MKNKKNLANAFKAFFLLVAAASAILFAACKTSPRMIEGRMVADVDPIVTAEITAQFENFLGTSINPGQVTVSFAPRSDEAILQFKMHANTYFLHLPSEARELVREGVARYTEDFDEQRLDRRMSKRKTEHIYGQVEGNYMQWGLGPLAMNGEGNPKIAAGYRFEKGSPYFTITVYSADNLNYKVGLSDIEKSIKYAIYMNKAQSLALAEELDEAVLLRSLDTVVVPVLAPDEYNQDAQDDNSGADVYGDIN